MTSTNTKLSLLKGSGTVMQKEIYERIFRGLSGLCIKDV